MEIIDLVGKVGNIVKETGKQVGAVAIEKGKEVRDYAKDSMEISNLRNQIASVSEIINKSYVTLGEYYYKKTSDCPPAEMCDQYKIISDSEKIIAELEAKIEEIKATQIELKAARAAAAEEAEELAKEAEDTAAAVDEELAKVKQDADSTTEEVEVFIDDTADDADGSEE